MYYALTIYNAVQRKLNNPTPKPAGVRRPKTVTRPKKEQNNQFGSTEGRSPGGRLGLTAGGTRAGTGTPLVARFRMRAVVVHRDCSHRTVRSTPVPSGHGTPVSFE